MHFTGTGDLMAALLLTWTHRHPGADGVAIAMEKAGATMQAVLKRTIERSRERGGGGGGGGGGGTGASGGGDTDGGGGGGDPAARRGARCSTRSGESRSRRWRRVPRWRSRTSDLTRR